MTASPTPAERLALKTANAALLSSPNAACDIVATVVFALGSAQLLQSPEIAAELVELRARVADWSGTRSALALILKHGEMSDTVRQEIALLIGDDPGVDGSGRTYESYSAGPEALHASSGAVIEIPPQPTAAAKCRCDEPGADPYACEADDCHGHFSELNPFGSGARPVNEGSAKVSRACPTCGWRTSVWHVADGSADAELHEHKARAHTSVEDPHDSPLHHDYRTGRDLPEVRS